MRNFDFTPLFRTSVGFDRMANLLDSLTQTEQTPSNYPPYNIEISGEDQYRISMAVAGFNQTELDIKSHDNTLTVNGKTSPLNTEVKYLHQGIAARNFERRFQLADYVKVERANLANGLLHIDLVREVPEAKKVKNITINTGQLLTDKEAA